MNIDFVRRGSTTTDEGFFDRYEITVSYTVSTGSRRLDPANLLEVSDLCAKVSRLGKDILDKFDGLVLDLVKTRAQIEQDKIDKILKDVCPKAARGMRVGITKKFDAPDLDVGEYNFVDGEKSFSVRKLTDGTSEITRIK